MLHPEPVWIPPPVEHYLATDPSECVSSDRIIASLKEWFDGFGGSILYYALDTTFYRNFDSGNAAHRAALEAAFEFEDVHLASLGHDNVHMICSKIKK
jgi:hypothetical protein